LTSINMGVT